MCIIAHVCNLSIVEAGQNDFAEFEASLIYLVRSCPKKPKEPDAVVPGMTLIGSTLLGRQRWAGLCEFQVIQGYIPAQKQINKPKEGLEI